MSALPASEKRATQKYPGLKIKGVFQVNLTEKRGRDICKDWEFEMS